MQSDLRIHKLPAIDSYWKKDYIFDNCLPQSMTLNYNKLISKALHFPINNCFLEKDAEEHNDNRNEDVFNIEYISKPELK